MNLLRRNIEVMFRSVPMKHMFRSLTESGFGQGFSVSSTGISKTFYREWARNHFPAATDSMLDMYYDHCYDMMRTDCNSRVHTKIANTDISVFNMLRNFTIGVNIENAILTHSGSEPLCKYDKIIRWQRTAQRLGQDLFACSYMAAIDAERGNETKVFSWPAVIRNDNNRLRLMLSDGLGENHFHLNASSRHFDLTWIAAMNHPTSVIPRLKLYKTKKDSNEPLLGKVPLGNNPDDSYEIGEIENMLTVAAYLRAKLFKRTFFSDNAFCTELSADIEKIAFTQFSEIDAFRFMYGYRTPENKYILDYALTNNLYHENYNAHRSLVGERNLLYHCFSKIYLGEFGVYEQNAMYMYLLIKSHFMSEIVQSNNRGGFQNFEYFQNRKVFLLEERPEYIEEMMNLSVRASLETQTIKSFELRIAPANTAYKLNKSINSYINSYNTLESQHARLNDGELRPHIGVENAQNLPFFFVLHFIKAHHIDEEVVEPYFTKYHIPIPYRGAKARELYKKHAIAILTLLERNPQFYDIIRGIDASSAEIGSRPEHMAMAYRFLDGTMHKLQSVFENKEPQRLRHTYHVGEDFLDLSDGLRAIDEAMLFLNLERGDRLGHTIALGLSAKDYYSARGDCLVMSKQNMLDNFVWLIHRADELGITLNLNLRDTLHTECHKLLNDIYGDGFNPGHIEQYFNAWKLRGDAPYCYQYPCCDVNNVKCPYGGDNSKCDYNNMRCPYAENGRIPYFKAPNDFDRVNATYHSFSLNPAVDDNKRNDPFLSEIYHRYHFDANVREKGHEVASYETDDHYATLITEIQHSMRLAIAERGIGIETNPSSNILITGFGKYIDHPILTFYNHGLGAHNCESEPQLHVSINTDDLNFRSPKPRTYPAGWWEERLKKPYKSLA